MAGPGARVEAFGTIFTRVAGLLRSGALKRINRPVWYDVYEAFPPPTEKQRTIESTTDVPEPPNILYLEDLVRAKFYRTYGSPGVMNLFDNSETSLSQQFVVKYFELEAAGVEKSSVFEATVAALKEEGIKLKTLKEIEKERQEAFEERQKLREAMKNTTYEGIIHQIYGQSPQEMAAEEDTISEELLDPEEEPEKR